MMEMDCLNSRVDPSMRGKVVKDEKFDQSSSEEMEDTTDSVSILSAPYDDVENVDILNKEGNPHNSNIFLIPCFNFSRRLLTFSIGTASTSLTTSCLTLRSPETSFLFARKGTMC